MVMLMVILMVTNGDTNGDTHGDTHGDTNGKGGTKLLNLRLGPAEGGTSGREKCFPYHLVFFCVFFLFGRGGEKCCPYYQRFPGCISASRGRISASPSAASSSQAELLPGPPTRSITTKEAPHKHLQVRHGYTENWLGTG